MDLKRLAPAGFECLGKAASHYLGYRNSAHQEEYSVADHESSGVVPNVDSSFCADRRQGLC